VLVYWSTSLDMSDLPAGITEVGSTTVALFFWQLRTSKKRPDHGEPDQWMLHFVKWGRYQLCGLSCTVCYGKRCF